MRRLILTSCSLAALLAVVQPGVAQETGRLQTQITPKVAGVFVDGEYKGIAAEFRGRRSALALSAGEHKVRIVDPRHEAMERTVTIQAGQTERVSGNLTPKTLAQPPFARLKIKGWGHAAVYLHDAFQGHADEFNDVGQALLVPAGDYTLRIEPVQGGQPLERKVTLTASQKTVITK